MAHHEPLTNCPSPRCVVPLFFSSFFLRNELSPSPSERVPYIPHEHTRSTRICLSRVEARAGQLLCQHLGVGASGDFHLISPALFLSRPL